MIKFFSGFGDSNEKELRRLQPQVDKINALRASERAELELPVGLTKLKFLPSLWSLIKKRR